MNISAQDVNKLRQMTGAGMMDCKKALTEANGNFEEAIIILRKKGQKVSASRADKEASEGAVFPLVNAQGNEGIIIALNCETDFVAKNDEFQQLGQKIAQAALAHKPANKEQLLALEIEGRTINDLIIDLVGKVGEKIEISSYEVVQGEKVISYVHLGSKLGVLVALTGVNGTDVSELGKDIALQIASMKPIAIDKEDINPAIIEKELEIAKEKARNEGKPEHILDKIAQGYLQSFYKENTLLNQTFVKDNSKTIAQLLKEHSANLKVAAFKRVSVA
ncbi:MAG: translation elongation factor Ts [Microscillaceae bacterium]|nr:translation elongation factor Ts [Microscillaceae bacterium]MDW8461213.1 translation elongation factor Ts [Cytophagales bacterium]